LSGGSGSVERLSCFHSSELEMKSREFFAFLPKQPFYVVPIQIDRVLVGLLLVCMQPGHHRNEREVRMLEAVANSFGSLVQRYRVELHLSETRLWLRSVVNNSSAIVYLKDNAGRYLMINGQFERIMGIAAEQALGKTDSELPPLPWRHNEQDLKVISSGHSRHQMDKLQRGELVHGYQTVKFPLYDDDHQVVGMGNISSKVAVDSAVQQER